MGVLNKKIFNSEGNFFAIDLSDLSVKVFEMEKKGRIDRVKSYNSKDIEVGKIEDGRILDKEVVSKIIQKAVRESGPKKIRTKKVVCSIPESKAFLRAITIPKMDEKEAAEAVKWEIEASIPLSIDQIYFDWQFLEKQGNKQKVLTVAVSREIIDDLVEVIRMAGFEVWGLEVESVATARSLIPQNSSREDISIIVDLGARRTSFIITEGNVPYFTSSIPFSSEAISDAISKELGVSKEEAEEIKVRQGIEHSLEVNSVFQAVEPLLENLSSEIQKSIDFYKEMSGTQQEVEKIILSGGGANLKGTVSYLTAKLSRKVVIGDPWVNFNLGDDKLPVISRGDSVEYTTAIGLAIGKINLWR
jgi:type IV pilus assembly protein PilM